MWTLQSIAGESEPSPRLTFRLGAGAVKTIGRARRADFVVDVAMVSRLHCRLTATGEGELLVEDLRSTNGTFVNGERIKRAVLRRGDRLRIGHLELLVGKSTQRVVR